MFISEKSTGQNQSDYFDLITLLQGDLSIYHDQDTEAIGPIYDISVFYTHIWLKFLIQWGSERIMVSIQSHIHKICYIIFNNEMGSLQGQYRLRGILFYSKGYIWLLYRGQQHNKNKWCSEDKLDLIPANTTLFSSSNFLLQWFNVCS